MARRRRAKGAAPGRRWRPASFVAPCARRPARRASASACAALWVFTILPRLAALGRRAREFDPSEGSKVYDDNDELITEFHVERRIFVPLAQMPKALREAIIATEDARFYSHYGVDPMGIARAVYQNFRRGRIVEGGSTITQQLAKVLFLTPDKSLERKLKEAVLAVELERRYSKDRILEMYLNQIYFGHGAFGVEAAARTFFGKSVSELDAVGVARCWPGLPKAPSTYSPFEHPDAAKRRRAHRARTHGGRRHAEGRRGQEARRRRRAGAGPARATPHHRPVLSRVCPAAPRVSSSAPTSSSRVGCRSTPASRRPCSSRPSTSLREGLEALESRRARGRRQGRQPRP